MNGKACMAPTGPGGIDDFRQILWSRLCDIYLEKYDRLGKHNFVMPVGLLLVLDEANGGDVTANELVRRFHLMDAQSQNIIDFYFLGWKWVDRYDRSRGIEFNLGSFVSCQETLNKLGIRFGGNADLILVDAVFSHLHVTLNFEEAIHVNLSRSLAEQEILSAGEFLQSIIDTAAAVRKTGNDELKRVVFRMSDRLGVASARTSFLDFMLKKWGEIIGAKKLKALAVRNIGPTVELDSLTLKAVSRWK